MTTQLIFGILWIVTILFATGFVGIWKKVQEDDKLSYIWEQVRDYANIAVHYAKDVGDNQELTGSERLKLAVNALKEVRDKIGIDIDDTQLEMLCRAAYQQWVADDIYIEEEVDGE